MTDKGDNVKTLKSTEVAKISLERRRVAEIFKAHIEKATGSFFLFIVVDVGLFAVKLQVSPSFSPLKNSL